MKLAYITHANIPDDWAHSVQIMNMCKAFAENGVTVTLVVPKRNLPIQTDPFEYYGMEKTFEIRKIPCIDVSVGSGSILLYWIRLVSFYISARIYSFFQHFDVVYSRDMYASLFFPGVIIERHSFPKKVSSLTKYMFRLSGGVVVLTSFIKERLKTINVAEKKILVAPDGVDIKAFERPREKLNISGIEEGDFVYGYIGTLKTMGQEKGVADCLKALKELSKHYKLLIVGGEPADIEHYRKMSEYLEVASQVVFVGKVPHADIPAYTQMCDVLVAPFPESEHYSFFMSPLKIFEYMASKRPIISTTLPSIREVLTDGLNAVLISPSDPSALARAITIFHDKPVFAQSISEKAYRDVTEKYTWNIRAKNIINFLRSMVL